MCPIKQVFLYTLYNIFQSSLKTIPAGAFRPLRSLEMLVLDNNLLSTLSTSALDGLDNLQVTVLSSHPRWVYT